MDLENIKSGGRTACILGSQFSADVPTVLGLQLSCGACWKAELDAEGKL